MGLHFILGPATADHDRALIDQVAATLRAHPDADVLYLVPNHIKFESEVQVLAALHQQLRPDDHIFAQSRLQVMSFSRLTWYYLNNTAIYQQARLTPAAAGMRIAKIMRDHEDELRVFAGERTHQGFTARLVQQLSELQMGGVTAADLDAALATMPDNDRHLPKLRDLATILRYYEADTVNTTSNADLLQALADYLHKQDLTNTYVFISHFNVLAAREEAIVTELMTRAAAVHVAITTDRPATTQPAAPDLFFPGKRLYYRLYQQARTHDVAIQHDSFAPARKVAVGIQSVERYWINATALREVPEHLDFAGVDLVKASDPYTELRSVARSIRQHVQRDGSRYGDFLIVARHLKPYETIVDAVANEFELPVFVDHERAMTNHPLIVFVDSLFGMLAHNYDYQNTLQLLRTELLVPANMDAADFRHALDVTENHILRTGMYGSQWVSPKPWQYYRVHPDPERDDAQVSEADSVNTQLINTIKDLVATTIPPFFHQLHQAKTGREMATALYQFLNQSGVINQLTSWRDANNDAGNLVDAQAGEQAWQVLCDILDDFVDTWGTEPATVDQFNDMIDAGFANATYTQIPSTLDQVTISETGLARLQKARYVYIIGATSTAMPDAITDRNLLTSDDRHVLAPYLPEGTFLPDAGADTALTEPFLNYLTFVEGTQQLTLSYPVHSDGDNDPSPYTLGIQNAGRLPWTIWQDATPTTPVDTLLGTPRSTLSDAIRVARQLKDTNNAISPAWTNTLRSISNHGLPALTHTLMSSLDYTNSVGELAPQLAHALYGNHLEVSISRLESFYRNPYEYFLKYGLALAPRPEFALTPADTGTLFHAVLDELNRQAADKGGIENLSDAELDQLVQQLVADKSTEPGFEVLTSSKRMLFIRDLLTALLTQSARAVRNEQRQSGFKVHNTELTFGFPGKPHNLPAIQLDLPDQQSVLVRGRIDRLDTVTTGDQGGFVVVDYKSSTHSFSAEDAYYGLGMQMLTYIDAVLRGYEPRLAPAAGVFMHLQNPRLKYSRDKQKSLAAAFKMDGLLVNGPGMAALDTTVTPDQPGSSDIFPFRFLKSGQLGNNHKTVTPEQLVDLIHHNEALIVAAAQAVLAGHMELAPARTDQKATVITMSDYSAIMQFDPTLRDNQYRQLTPLSLEAVLAKIAQERSNNQEG